MVRVCEDVLPAKGKNQAGFYMNSTLKSNLDLLIKNIVHDWDFVIIISGTGRVRVGKSLLAMQIGFYWTYMLKKVHGIEVPYNVKDNILFQGTRLIKQGNYLGQKHPCSCLIFDEAGADLESMKVMRRTTQDVKDFLRECGQYNLLNILVLPEFFDLPKGIALGRSDLLLNVETSNDDTGLITRGFFKAYARDKKKKLYLYGKKELNYSVTYRDFRGRFYNNYPLDEEEYREAKKEAMRTREKTASKDKFKEQRDVAFLFLEELGKKPTEISNYLKSNDIMLGRMGVSHGIAQAHENKYNKIRYKDTDMGGEEAEE